MPEVRTELTEIFDFLVDRYSISTRMLSDDVPINHAANKVLTFWPTTTSFRALMGDNERISLAYCTRAIFSRGSGDDVDEAVAAEADGRLVRLTKGFEQRCIVSVCDEKVQRALQDSPYFYKSGPSLMMVEYLADVGDGHFVPEVKALLRKIFSA